LIFMGTKALACASVSALLLLCGLIDAVSSMQQLYVHKYYIEMSVVCLF